MRDLTSFSTDRQTILNNRLALERIREDLNIRSATWRGEPIFTKAQAAALLEIGLRTVEHYITDHGDELRRNGYRLLTSIEIREIKAFEDVSAIYGGDILPADSDIHVGAKTPLLSVFTFRALLNLAMLVTESERAKVIRSRILDLAFESIKARVGGNTKYINQRDADYLPSAFQEETYRKGFTKAVDDYVEGNQWKYKHCTDAIYKAIFRENAREYRKILKLENRDNLRDTFYAELLTVIASFEAGLPDIFRQEAEKQGRSLRLREAVELVYNFGEQAFWVPILNDVRTKIASRDLTFRDALHHRLEAYIQHVPEGDYERFLGEKSKALQARIDESLEVYKELRDR